MTKNGFGICLSGLLRHDLLVYHSPKPERKLVVEPRPELENARLSTQYFWEGYVKPGFSIQFSHVLIPHVPEQKAHRLASAIEFIKDDSHQVVLKFQNEWLIMNPEGNEYSFPIDSSQVSSDAKVLYIVIEDEEMNNVLALEAGFLNISGREIFSGQDRRDFEQLK